MRKKVIIKKKIIKPDVRYSSVTIRKLINKLMKSGEFRKSQKIVYTAADIVEKEIKTSFAEVLEEVIENLRPGIEIKTKKYGGGRQKTISKTTPARDRTIALQILKDCFRNNKNTQSSAERLAKEIKDAFEKTGSAIKKKESILKEAETSRVSAY